MTVKNRRHRRAAAAALALILCPGIPAGAQNETGNGLPFSAKVKKEAFEKRIQQGTAQVLGQYRASLLAITERQFTTVSAEGLETVRKELKRFDGYLKQLEKSEPLDFIAERLRRLNRGEVELEAHLSESVWKLTDGRHLKLLFEGRIAFDGKVDRFRGWEVAGANHFVWGGRFWKAEVRDKRRRFNATTWTAPKMSMQGVIVDSVDYNGAPRSLMSRELGKTKLQLAGGVKTLIREYAATLKQLKKSQLQEENLKAANAIQKEWESLYEASSALFGTEVDLGAASEAIQPLFQSADEMKSGLTGTTWKLPNGEAIALNGRGKANLTSREGLPLGDRGWEALDARTIVYGYNYNRVRFDPRFTSFQGASRKSGKPASGNVEKRRKR